MDSHFETPAEIVSAALGETGPNWPAPDMAILRQHRRAAPTLPLSVFGPHWSPWIVAVAKAASAPPDYVAATLLAVASALVGNAR